ncbi:MAG: cob(I)yrinic acid a,c-diamide adenosyltransferase [Candidatus Kapabacteria bacterium]|nr:cob(I)yrinic acid a,c-diamide adenosyltransferase [Candidatus Kapabacteria bacterium]
MKIYTKTGDDGTTGLFSGKRVSKSDLRVETYGTVDELNSIIGIILTYDLPKSTYTHLTILSNLLFIMGSDLATPADANIVKYKLDRIEEKHIEWLEKLIDKYSEDLPELKNFILPGGTRVAALCHLARTVCRRAERLAVALKKNEPISNNVVVFLNRLSDFLFTTARYINHLSGIKDVIKNNNIELKI